MLDSSVMIGFDDAECKTCKVYTSDMLVKSPDGGWFQNPRFVVDMMKPTEHKAVMTPAEFRNLPWGKITAVPRPGDSSHVDLVLADRKPITLVTGRICSGVNVVSRGNGDDSREEELRKKGFCFSFF